MTDISDERKAEIYDSYMLQRKAGVSDREAADQICREYSVDPAMLKDIIEQLRG
jgi:hypothetical protein